MEPVKTPCPFILFESASLDLADCPGSGVCWSLQFAVWELEPDLQRRFRCADEVEGRLLRALDLIRGHDLKWCSEPARSGLARRR